MTSTTVVPDSHQAISAIIPNQQAPDNSREPWYDKTPGSWPIPRLTFLWCAVSEDSQTHHASPSESGLSFPELYTEEYLEKRRKAVAREEGERWKGVDATDPKCPAGHARGMRISVALTSDYRQTHRKGVMDIKPQEVIEVLKAAGVKKWVLMCTP